MTNKMPLLEVALARLDNPPFNAVNRFLIGFIILPAYQTCTPHNLAPWTLLVFFLAVLVGLRVFPALFRHICRFSPELQAIWRDRRQIAKRYDSFQWQKLFWMGLGILAYIVTSGNWLHFQVALAGGCIFAGGLGLISWKRANPARNLSAAS